MTMRVFVGNIAGGDSTVVGSNTVHCMNYYVPSTLCIYPKRPHKNCPHPVNANFNAYPL